MSPPHRLPPILYPVLAGIGLLASAFTARAATYNFYFNGVEQGANSTATPTVTVQQPGDGQPPTVVPPPAPALATSVAEMPPAPPAREWPPFYVMLTLAGYAQESEYRSSYSSSSSGGTSSAGFDDDYEFGGGASGYGTTSSPNFGETSRHNQGAVGVEFGAQLSRRLSAGGMLLSGGGYGGGSRAWSVHGEYMVLGGEFFHREDWFQLTALAGLGNLGAMKDLSLTNTNQWHGGARTRFNLGPDWGLMVGARGNASFVLGELGFLYRF